MRDVLNRAHIPLRYILIPTKIFFQMSLTYRFIVLLFSVLLILPVITVNSVLLSAFQIL